MANFIGRLGVLLGLDSAEFQKGIQQASKQLDSFVEKAKATSAVGATAFAAMAYEAMRLADEIVDTAKANDVAVDSVLKLRNALALSGGEAENAGKLYSSFTANIDKAAEGSYETQKTFKTLGVSLDDLRKMNITELFSKTVENLAQMEDPLTRNAKAMELFGKASKGVDFVGLNEELKNGAGVTDAQAKAIEDAAAAFDALKKSGRDFSVMLASELGPSIKTTIDYLTDIKGKGDGLGQVFKTVFQTVAVLGSDVAFVLKGIAGELAAIYKFSDDLINKNLATASANYSEYFKNAIKDRQDLDEYQRRIMGGGGGYGGGVSSFDDSRRLDRKTTTTGPQREVKKGLSPEEKKAIADAEAAAKKLEALRAKGFAATQAESDEYRKLMGAQQDAYTQADIAQKERQKAASIEIDRAKEMLDLTFKSRNMRGEDLQYAQELKEIEFKRLDAIKQIENDQTLNRKAREDALNRENQLAEKAIDLAKTRLELTRQTREGTLKEGFFNAMETMSRNASTQFEQGQQVFQSVMGNMESSLNNFVKTGKLSFKDLARSIIQDIIAIQLKAAATKFLGGLFTMNPMTMTQTDFVAASGGRMFADGGDPPVGKPSIVGERGPELFVPRTAGTIIPNNALSNMGGSTNVTNNYINAIDAKSFENRLLESSNTIWAGYQYANKQLASNGRRA
jgi:lambda family phage tail tape measure protein